jgi:hypothetical protein
MNHTSMKLTLASVLSVAALNCAFAIPNFDPFANATGSPGGTSYTVGAPLAPNTSTNSGGGANTWALVNSNVIATNPQPLVVAGNLSYTGLPASTGNSVSNAPAPAGTGASARLGLSLATAPSLAYYSLILQVTGLGAVPSTSTANTIAAFSDTVGGQAGSLQRMGGRLVAKTSGAGYVLGVGKGSTTADFRYDATERAVGDVVFVVVSYERAGGATNVNLWVNPPLPNLGVDPAPSPNASVPQGANAGDLNAGGVSAFVLSCQTTTSPNCIIDEVRVSTNWANVTGGNPTFPISITSQPASRNVKVGDRVGFVVGASGTLPSYQWRFNGADISGATTQAYPIASAQTTDAGSYSVVVTNISNARTSTAAVLTVSTTPLQLYETNLVVVRVGDGSQTLTTSGNSVFLDQFTTNGTYLNTIFIPDSGASPLIESGPDLNGSTLTGTALTRSANKRLMALSGYKVGITNTTALQATFPTNVPRGVVTIDSSSQITLAVADTNAYSGVHFRGAATDGTNNFWGSGSAEGTWYFGLNSPSNLVQTTFPNTRSVDIFNGNLYTLASSTMNGLLKFTGLPRTDQGIVPNILTGFNSTTTTDFAVDPTDTLIYLTVGTTVQKWQWDGSSLWTNAYALSTGGTEQARYLTADFSGPSPVLYVTTADGGNGLNRLVTIVDTNKLATAVTLANSGPNQLFKGIRFGPILTVPRPVLSFTHSGSDLTLSWSGLYTLVCSTNVAGPYSDVAPAAASPFTTNTTSPAAQFFGLRKN